MATQAISAAPSNSTDAYFRDWGKKVSDAMEAVGFTKTADTGQIDWAIVVKPAAVSTYQGYEIRAFSDALQATLPVIVKLEYGSASGNANNPSMRLTIGRASDGAGKLLGAISTLRLVSSAGSSTTAADGYISGASGRVAVGTAAGATTGFAFYIERTKDSSGNPTAIGVNVVCLGLTSKSQQVMTDAGFFPNAAMANVCCLAPFVGAGTYGSDIGLYPIQPNLGYSDNPDLGGCMYFTGDIAAKTSVALTILGASHTYITMGITCGSLNGNATANSIALRYE